MILWTERYKNAHHEYTRKKAPGFLAMSGGEEMKVTLPDVRKSNGLTRAIINFINWSGGNADRCSTVGRLVKAPQRQASGTVIQTTKMISSANRRGSADITATIKGRSVKIEIKIGPDKPSKEQLGEQERETRAGGVYIFIKTMDEFIFWYDNYLLTLQNNPLM